MVLSVEADCYQGFIFPKQSKLAVCVNESNDLVILDYFLRPLQTVSGVRGPAFSKSMSKSSLTGGDLLKVNWFKGNHQSALIDLETGDEDERAPLFGTVSDYSENIPMLSAYANSRWCGLNFYRNGFHFAWMEKDRKESLPINKAIPEAQNIYSLHLTRDAQFIVALIASSKEVSLASLILVSLRFGSTFPLVDYRRVTSSSPDFVPSVSKDADGQRFVLNTGNSLTVFGLSEQGRFEQKGEVSQITSGSVS